ncbi:hypothetical protein G4Y73_11225 [Wenzhouxiangella sp. XN201]|uniref:hypothetical protein n=1 Tax=Wenzhouxiangella sp. XN201 TaxID=2710755 RepID=UPI0013C9A74C|nr:hypothetical protein [Wenzhouxiangella sp. XN201]NEZ04724.1 hypothetical protein [Wenzhouxiangella sp. XN201]
MRTVRGVVAALALMAGVVLLFLVPLSIIMGPQRALDESLAFNNLWIGISMVVSLIAACIGGWVVHRLSGSLGAVIGLVVVVAVLGLIDAAWHQWFLPVRFLVEAPQAWYQMLLLSREPLWYDLTLPFLMAVFIWVAGASRAIEHPNSVA